MIQRGAALGRVCGNHPERPAASRCQVCLIAYCAECVSEYEDRMVCSACLQRKVQTRGGARFGFLGAYLLSPLWVALGFCLSWGIFYGWGRWLIWLARP